MRQIALHFSPLRDQLGGDRYRNLFGSNGPNIQPDWGMDAVEQVRGQTFGLQLFEDGDCLPLRPDHPDVTRRSLHRPTQHSHIVAVPARDDHDVRRLARRELRRGLLEIVGDHLLRLGEAFAIRVGLAIIHHRDVESRDSGNLVKACRYVTCTENIKVCWR